ncbi:uncharacterized protein LOC116292674 [Actinia tenebrosa]|uniref:Uncharacterized protein LOC116292674 n=1 Tax=Actinia tenebrosa TaxID=6105 RepID=A0A6P8HHK5_ACTTE|nr:uncharacterized protein LOC116292674 [Actinia tenebrosa]
MDTYAALVVPGVLTILVVVLTWIYMRNASRLASESLATEMTSSMKRNDKNRDEEKEELEISQENDQDSLSDENLREELEKYMIKPGEIQDVSLPIPLDNETIQHEMKEKGFENIQTYYKTSKLQIKEMEDMLTRQERELEREAQRKQLEEIFKLMASEKEKFGVDSMDQVEDQMKLYVQ